MITKKRIRKVSISQAVNILSEFDAICVCAVRYSLGRKTYMPRLVMDYLKDNMELLKTQTLRTVVKDVNDYYERFESDQKDDFDYKEWIAFKVFIEGEIERRRHAVAEDI